MAATLANGGVNPVTRERVIDAIHCQHVLAVMVTAGLYEKLRRLALRHRPARQERRQRRHDHGLARQGRTGHLRSAARCAGNSVKGQLTARFLSERLGLNLFASEAWSTATP